MPEESHLERLSGMTDSQLDYEMSLIMQVRSDGYDRLRRSGVSNRLAETTITLCDESMEEIRKERVKRRKAQKQ